MDRKDAVALVSPSTYGTIPATVSGWPVGSVGGLGSARSAGIDAVATGTSSQVALPPSVNSSTGYADPAAAGSRTRMTAVLT